MHTLPHSAPSAPPLVAVPALDEGGFLIDANAWDPQAAEAIAKMCELGPLTEAHWQVIYFVRAKYLRFGALPAMRSVCRGTGVTPDAIHDLFGSCDRLLKVAGIPDPGEEAKSYFPA